MIQKAVKAHKGLIFITGVTFIALFYVNQQTLVYQIGLRVKENTQIHSNLVDRNRILVYNVLNLKSPVNLETRLLAREVELNMPRKWQVVKLEKSPKSIAQGNVNKKGLFASLLAIGREAEASPGNRIAD